MWPGISFFTLEFNEVYSRLMHLWFQLYRHDYDDMEEKEIEN